MVGTLWRSIPPPNQKYCDCSASVNVGMLSQLYVTMNINMVMYETVKVYGCPGVSAFAEYLSSRLHSLCYHTWARQVDLVCQPWAMILQSMEWHFYYHDYLYAAVYSHHAISWQFPLLKLFTPIVRFWPKLNCSLHCWICSNTLCFGMDAKNLASGFP